MALTGIQIFKLLPQTNCKECGAQTCLAFAMNLASGKAELDSCPYISEASREKLAEASAPPVRAVSVGKGTREFKAGGETVLFRHEKTFYNPPAFAVKITSDVSADELRKRIEGLQTLQYERIGLYLRPELIALQDTTGIPEEFASRVEVITVSSDFGLILMSEKADVIRAGLEICADRRPLIYGATHENAEELGPLAVQYSVALGIRADSVDELMSLSDRLTQMGVKDLVLDPGSRTIIKSLEDQVAIRRAALKKGNRALGFPTIAFPCEMASDLDMETLIAAMHVAKYCSIVVLSDFRGENLFPLLLQRLNIFTDPQRPMTVKEGIYAIGNPGKRSPVLVTTNFALTYFIVSGEIESSRIPAWLLIKDAEGLSVMTAWAAGKFSGDDVAAFVKKSGIEDQVDTRELIIPGYAAMIAGDIEEDLAGWSVTVGPREAAHLPVFLRKKVS